MLSKAEYLRKQAEEKRRVIAVFGAYNADLLKLYREMVQRQAEDDKRTQYLLDCVY